MAGQAAVGDGNSALALSWAFGFNKDIPGGVHNLSDDTRSAIFYVAAHSGVVYDFINRKQLLLQGHCNPITCCCVSGDKRWIATADAGPESMIVVWDSLSGTPIKTMFQPHPHGVAAMDMSPDAMFLVTLGAPPPSPGDEEGGAGAGGSEYDEGKMGGGDGGGDGEPQQLALWEWTVEREGPLYVSEVPGRESHCYVRFNSTDVREIVSNGLKEVRAAGTRRRRRRARVRGAVVGGDSGYCVCCKNTYPRRLPSYLARLHDGRMCPSLCPRYCSGDATAAVVPVGALPVPIPSLSLIVIPLPPHSPPPHTVSLSQSPFMHTHTHTHARARTALLTRFAHPPPPLPLLPR